MTWPDITERTAGAAYAQSGFGPDDLDLVELHDAFAIAELLHAEALGIAERGRHMPPSPRGSSTVTGGWP